MSDISDGSDRVALVLVARDFWLAVRVLFGVAWRGVARRSAAWRGAARRGEAWRVVVVVWW